MSAIDIMLLLVFVWAGRRELGDIVYEVRRGWLDASAAEDATDGDVEGHP